MKQTILPWSLSVAVLIIGALTLPGSSLLDPAVAPMSPTVLTLEDAIAIALTNSPVVVASDARVDAAGGRARQAGRWSNPALELSVEEWPVSGGGSFSDAKQTIGVVQELPFPGKKSLDRRVGEVGMRVSEELLALRRTELVRDVKASFSSVLAARRAVEVSAQLLSVAEFSANTARQRVDAGAAAYQEQLRAEVQLEHARTSLRDLERKLVAARQVFLTLLGRPELGNVILSGTLETEADLHLLVDEPGEGLARHPSATAAQASLDRARLTHQRARLEPYPDVSVGVAGGRLGETDESILELGLSVPLPILDAGKGRQQETLAQVRAAEAELHAVQQDLQRAWAMALDRYRAAVEQVDRYRNGIVPKSGEAMTLVQTGFEEGKFSFIDLLDTQRTAAESQLGLQEKLLEMNIAQAELEALLAPEPVASSTGKQEHP
jgi:cobalt-zinc-cadmium efflux system outer membrane protein